MAINRHLQNPRTSDLEYVSTLKSRIPVDATVYQVDAVPTIEEIRSGSVVAYDYIQLTGNSRYYKLTGKSPNVSNLLYGEMAISISKGYESIRIKNSSNQIVEFAPYKINTMATSEVVLYNPQIEATSYTDPDTGATVNQWLWKIPYTTLTTVNINPDTSVVNLREVSTGKQLVPDVKFDDTSKNIIITINVDDTTTLRQNKYKALIIGTSYPE